MGANQQFTRIDTLELKDLLYQKIGHQRADKYLDLLKKLLSLQLTKSDFDKFCIRTIGRENLPLHNRLIRSILLNASLAKVPPLKVKKLANSLNVKVSNAHQKNTLHSLHGDAFSLLPRKSRSPRGRKFRDRPSPLGPNGKTHEKVPVEQHQSPTELHSLGSRPPNEVISVEDGEEAVSRSPGIQSRSPVTAPLGIAVKVSEARKTLLPPSSHSSQPQTCHYNLELPDTKSLRSRLKQKLECFRMSIPEDSANLINLGLDEYLKGIMEPCIELAQSKMRQTERYQQMARISSASLLDFIVSLENDPRKLGGDWSTQFEQIRIAEWKNENRQN